jgi:aconitate hydratase
MAETLVTKLLRTHLANGSLAPSEEVQLRVDQVLLEDYTGTMACLQFETLEVDRITVPFAIQYVDHNVLQLDWKDQDDHRYLKSICARYGLVYSTPGNGICHYLHLERFARPGLVLVGADSHTTMAGAVGMFAVGAGGLDVALCLAGQPFSLSPPREVGVDLRGRLSPWVQAKDVVLELLRRRGVRGGVGCAFEFFGEGVSTLNVTQRGTICNMVMETGATTGVFPSDERTHEWLATQQRAAEWQPLSADPGAAYDEVEVIDLDSLEPLIAKPSSPGNVVPVREVAGTPVGQVCVGSSVNSGYEDLALVGAVLRGNIVDRRLVMTVTPGSRQIQDRIIHSGTYLDLVQSGARMLEPICGPCIGIGQAPGSGIVSVRTFNRNFPGRSGTDQDQVYLSSPATAAATALRGVITDPRELGEEPSLPPTKPPDVNAYDRHFIFPSPQNEALRVQVFHGPNVVPPPQQSPLPEKLTGRVLIVVGDDISTGDLSPDGVVVMSFCSNVEAMANFVFRRLDPQFPTRARNWGGGFIVGGHNYGQGSSREHAVLAPKQLGVRAVVAKSFARIHRRNLIAQGLVPLTLADEADYERVQQGDRWEISELHAILEQGESECSARIVETGEQLRLQASFTPRERQILLVGGLLAYTRSIGTGALKDHKEAEKRSYEDHSGSNT